MQGTEETFGQASDFDLVALAMPQGWELLIILALVFLLFGAKKMPDAARGIGRSLRILKTETQGLRDDDGSGEAERSADETDEVPPVNAHPESPQIATVAQPVDPLTTNPSSPRPAAEVRDDR